MERPNSFETNHESNSDSKVNFMKSILRMAPVLASVLAMSACGDKEELNKCQIEVAGMQGALEGVGVKHEAPKVDDLQACKIEKSKLDGIMEGWKLTHPEITKPKVAEPSVFEKQIKEDAEEAMRVADELPPLNGSETERIEMHEEGKVEAQEKPIDSETTKEVKAPKYDAAKKYREDFNARVKAEIERRKN